MNKRQHNKDHGKVAANIFSREKAKRLLRFTQARMPTLTACIQHSTENPKQGNQERKKRDKVYEIVKKEVEQSLFTDCMIWYDLICRK